MSRRGTGREHRRFPGNAPLAAGSTHHRVLQWSVLGIIVIAVAVAVILLLQRHRDRRSIDETTAASLKRQETIPVTRSQGLTTGPRREDTTSERTKELPHGHYGLAGLLRSEWTKLRTVRSTMWTVGFTILIGVALAAIFAGAVRVHWATMTPSKRASFDPLGISMVGVYFGVLAIGILGVLAISAEYSTGTVHATFCAVPRRPLVLAAKAIVFGVVALVISVIRSRPSRRSSSPRPFSPGPLAMPRSQVPVHCARSPEAGSTSA